MAPALPARHRRWLAAAPWLWQTGPVLRPIFLLLLLAGCAAPPLALPPPPLSYPPTARERILRLATAEWREWGCVTTGLLGPPLTPCQAPGPTGPEGAADNFPRVLAYWRSVPQAAEAILPNRARYAAALRGEGGGDLWAEPFWSAAFISWVIGAAGVDAPEFAPDAAHSRYLDHLDRLAELYPTQAPFLPRDPNLYAPRAGDLVCRDRSRQPLPSWADRAAERGRFRPMHCDVVITARAGVIEAVGGNVSDSVTLARWATDEEGRLLPDPRPFLVIMENRLGRTPPWS